MRAGQLSLGRGDLGRGCLRAQGALRLDAGQVCLILSQGFLLVGDLGDFLQIGLAMGLQGVQFGDAALAPLDAIQQVALAPGQAVVLGQRLLQLGQDHVVLGDLHSGLLVAHVGRDLQVSLRSHGLFQLKLGVGHGQVGLGDGQRRGRRL